VKPASKLACCGIIDTPNILFQKSIYPSRDNWRLKEAPSMDSDCRTRSIKALGLYRKYEYCQNDTT